MNEWKLLILCCCIQGIIDLTLFQIKCRQNYVSRYASCCIYILLPPFFTYCLLDSVVTIMTAVNVFMFFRWSGNKEVQLSSVWLVWSKGMRTFAIDTGHRMDLISTISMKYVDCACRAAASIVMYEIWPSISQCMSVTVLKPEIVKSSSSLGCWGWKINRIMLESCLYVCSTMATEYAVNL